VEASGGKQRRHLSAQAWREAFGRFDGSGESVAGFCKREGLNKSSFWRWRRRLSMAEPVSTMTPSPQRKARERARPTPQAGFIEMGAMAAASEPAGRLEVRVELGGGLVLQLVRG